MPSGPAKAGEISLDLIKPSDLEALNEVAVKLVARKSGDRHVESASALGLTAALSRATDRPALVAEANAGIYPHVLDGPLVGDRGLGADGVVALTSPRRRCDAASTFRLDRRNRRDGCGGAFFDTGRTGVRCWRI